MSVLKRLLRAVFGVIRDVVLFVLLALAWGIGLMLFTPWRDAGGEGWQAHNPVLLTDAAGRTGVMRWRDYLAAKQRDPQLVPWPVEATGRLEVSRDGKSKAQIATWSSIANKPWRFELKSDNGDRISEVRYRLDGELPVLVETRERGPEIGFMSMPLALASLLAWKALAWWWRRRAG